MPESAPRPADIAFDEMAKAHDFAVQTGVLEALPEDAAKHGIEATSPGDSFSRTINVETPDASIYSTHISDGVKRIVSASTEEQTGAYYTPDITAKVKNGKRGISGSEGNVLITRPDGTGGIYKQTLRGNRARGEKATEIISRRASRKIGHAAAKRAVIIGNEYLNNGS